MKKEKFEKAILNATKNEIHYYEKVNEETKEFFKKINLPNELRNFFEMYSFTNFIKFGNVYYDKVNSFVENNTEEYNEKCIENNLLIIGFGVNGDFVVVNLNDFNVGFVFYELLYESSDMNFKNKYVDLNCKIDEFYYNSIFVENYPVDASQARIYVEKMHAGNE